MLKFENHCSRNNRILENKTKLKSKTPKGVLRLKRIMLNNDRPDMYCRCDRGQTCLTSLDLGSSSDINSEERHEN